MRNANVLVVDDDDLIRPLLVEYLIQHSRIAADAARDGMEALHFIATEHYRVIVLDVMMPKMTGVDLLESLAAMISDPSIIRLDAVPAVVVITATSATTLPSDTLHTRFPGLVRAVLRKPLDMDALVGCVERWL